MGTSPAEFEAVLAFPSIAERHAFEIAATMIGVKRVVRVVVPVEHIEPCSRCLRSFGLHVAMPTRALAIDEETSLGDRYCRHVPLDDPDATEAALLASLNRQVAVDGLRIDENGSVRQIGELYGYPPCCVARYERIQENPDWITPLIFDHSARMGKPPSVSNKLAYLFNGRSFLPDYFPCSLYCQASAVIARQMRRAALEVGLSELVVRAERETRRPLIVCSGTLLRPRSFRHEAGHLSFAEGEVDMFAWRGHEDCTSVLSRAAGARCSDGTLTLIDAAGATLMQDDEGAIVEFQEDRDAD